jgi:hypothetical protein
VAVPLSRLADIVEVSKKEMDELGLFASILGHIGDGNFHESIIYNKTDKVETAKVETCVKNMVKRALEMEGTCTGEHSIGWGKKESLVWEVGHDTLGVMVSLQGGPNMQLDLPAANKPTESHQICAGSELDYVGLSDTPIYQDKLLTKYVQESRQDL